MKGYLKLVGTTFFILGGIASLLDLIEKFFPGSSSVIVIAMKGFITNNWLVLIVIGLLIAILVMLVKENRGTQLSNGQEPPQ